MNQDFKEGQDPSFFLDQYLDSLKEASSLETLFSENSILRVDSKEFNGKQSISMALSTLSLDSVNLTHSEVNWRDDYTFELLLEGVDGSN